MTIKLPDTQNNDAEIYRLLKQWSEWEMKHRVCFPAMAGRELIDVDTYIFKVLLEKMVMPDGVSSGDVVSVSSSATLLQEDAILPAFLLRVRGIPKQQTRACR